jgi:hypothetical protein
VFSQVIDVSPDRLLVWYAAIITCSAQSLKIYFRPFQYLILFNIPSRRSLAP